MRPIVAGLAGLLALALLGGLAQAGPPTDQLKEATDRVLKTLQDPELRKPEKTDERRKQVRGIANEIFDWKETGKRALGRNAQGCNAQQREEFSPLFADLIERSYVGKLELYSGERIVYAAETVEADQATVRTKLITKSGTEIPIDYRLQKQGDRWRVYDVTIEGVSLVGNYRGQFNRIIVHSNCGELVKKLKTKQDELVFDDAERGKKKP
jgi:phospholipid transport system substrate-binding protein